MEIRIKNLYENSAKFQEKQVVIKGWVRNNRDQKNLDLSI